MRAAWIALEVAGWLAVLFVALLAASRIVYGHDMYMDWRSPDTGGSCCSGNADTGDCRRVRAYLHDDGWWRAETPNGWLMIPPAKVLPFQAPDGNAHLCEINGRIFCFAAPVPKS